MPSATMMILLAVLAPNPGAATVDPSVLRGTVGVCIRWAEDPNHVAEAVVVAPSGNPALDEAIPRSVQNMRWDRPGGEYRGGWIGIILTIGEPAPPSPRLPSCKHLPPPPAKVDPAAV